MSQRTSTPVDTLGEAGRQMIGKGWLQGLVLVFLSSFLIMAFLGYKTYTDSTPVPAKVVSQSGEILFTQHDIEQGQELFSARGIMEYGSIVGHGAYLGPDFTADYLRMATNDVADQLKAKGMQDTHAAVVEMFRTNRYDAASKTITYTPEQVTAFQHITQHYATYFGADSYKNGFTPNFITDPTEIRQLTAFFSWTAWGAAAERPGKTYSYTNNWPAEPRVENVPTASMLVWSGLSLCVLLGGTGILFGIYGRWSRKIGWHSEEIPKVSYRQPGQVALTPAQRVTVWFTFIIAALFVAQTLLGALTEHYRADLSSFFGIPMAKLLPYNLARTWHLQLSLFWTAAGFLAAGIFLVPLITKREPRKQNVLTWVLLGALVFVVVGSLLSEAFSIHGFSWAKGPLFAQQWEWLDLPFVYQILLTLGMVIWIGIIYRGLRGHLKKLHRSNMPWLFFFSALTIPAFYAVGLLARPTTNLAVADFWRFWVVHLWVEDFLELFTTVMVAYVFVHLGVVRERIAVGIIVMDAILYSMGGVVGTMHHLYFSGTPVENMALGAFFSAAEVIPLTFLTVEAWAFMQLGARDEAGRGNPFPHRWAVMFLVAVGFWNFVGAGIFGFLINLPIVSYYEIGTALTANHAHAAMMGVYGMLAIGLSMFALRYFIPDEKWPARTAKWSFWLLNIGLAWMVFGSLLPLGIMQLYHAVGSGYYEARTLGYLTTPGNTVVEWMRMPGDIVFIVGAVLFLWIAFVAVRHWRTGETTHELPEDVLYTQLEEAER
ncbi:nitric-oxide reductase large subunit [Aestuariimicrobium sp. T2.26MG-19.2B]|uniref:nitric-oxide reductase large subunit n=1 Tax=Aestuariimicrobium sp. T2.26MG-19.2B TaxID=3040679 RepID=UPI002477C950|nr:cbb3-type cytochrome c oxidase subunit I [Aestuariimicrobium sp. T2.26MG-19.2B]CAI9409149.1 hypothetical protein AESSP_02176 [Aestuariimicrobium sp. T2.26MG-19.2B]